MAANKKPCYIVAIDPDVTHSGVARISLPSKVIDADSLPFPVLIDRLREWKEIADSEGVPIKVIVEAGWLNRSNWHLIGRESPRIAAAKGNAVGRNHETGRKIFEMAKHIGLEVEEVKPLLKRWQGPDGKITAKELEQITGQSIRCSQDVRDAILLAWVFADIPIKTTFVPGSR